LVVTKEEPHITVAIGRRDKNSGLYKLSSLSHNLEAHFLELPNELRDSTPESIIDTLMEEESNTVNSGSPVSAAGLSKTLSPEKQRLVNLWHARLGHLSYANLSKISLNIAGVPALPQSPEVCESCQKEKQTRQDFPK
jgi:hypothetical protein